LLTDDDFRELVDRIPAGATFTFISDSCHSGGLIDAEKEQIGNSSGGGIGGISGGGGSGSIAGGLLGLVSQGLGLRTRDFEFPGDERRHNDVGEYTEGHRRYGGEEGYGGEGPRRYGGEEQYDEGYERRGRRHGGYEEEEGYGRRRGAEEEYGRRHGREEGYEGHRGRRSEEQEYSEELGRGRRHGGEERYENYEHHRGRRSEEQEYSEELRRGRRGEEEYWQEGGYGQGGGYGHEQQPQRVQSKEIPVSMLTQILSERTGHRVDVGNIRTTLFDMFGDQASPSVKIFADLVLQQLQVGIEDTPDFPFAFRG
jgi:hypothetical protein